MNRRLHLLSFALARGLYYYSMQLILYSRLYSLHTQSETRSETFSWSLEFSFYSFGRLRVGSREMYIKYIATAELCIKGAKE